MHSSHNPQSQAPAGGFNARIGTWVQIQCHRNSETVKGKEKVKMQLNAMHKKEVDMNVRGEANDGKPKRTTSLDRKVTQDKGFYSCECNAKSVEKPQKRQLS
jgi:hypothetical protein